MSAFKTLGVAAVGCLVVAGGFAACGGKADPSSGTGSNGQPGAATGYVNGTHSPGCPETQPAERSACSTRDLTCEYGDSFDAVCNAQLICAGGTWGNQVFRQKTCAGSKGPPVDPPPPPNPPACPGAKPGGACSGTVECRYGETLCACGPICKSYPVSQCEDGGSDWRCAPSRNSPICPVPRPRLGDPCTQAGESCRLGDAHRESCEESSISCRDGKWTYNSYGCPISSAAHKENIRYLGDDDLRGLQSSLRNVRLATYNYRPEVGLGDAPHLGFIIEDQPMGSPAVLAGRDRVDLYGYVSMAVATLQVQAKEIESLRRDVAALEAAQGARCPPSRE